MIQEGLTIGFRSVRKIRQAKDGTELTQGQAEIIALNALGWLVEAELLDTFQATTGADRETVRTAAGDPEFLGAVLDFVLMNDDWVRGVCTAQAMPFETLLRARASLPGGNVPHWT